MARPTIERTLRWLLWGAGILAFVWVLRRADLRGAFPVFAAAGPVLVLALLPFIGQIALDALAWRTLLGGLGHRLAWSRLIAIRLATEAVLQSMPGGSLIGESLKPYLVRRAAPVPVSDAIASIAIQRCLLALAQAGYLALAVAVAHDLYARSSIAIVGTGGLVGYVAAAAVGLAIVAVGLGLGLWSASFADRARHVLAKLPSRRVRAALEARRTGFAATDRALAVLGQHRARVAIAWTLLGGAWLIETVETYLVCRLVGIELDLTHALAMEAAVVFVRNVAFVVPAGLGVQDAGYLAFLAAFGVAPPLATAFVVTKRIKELIWIATGYLVLWSLDRRPRAAASQAALGAPSVTPCPGGSS